MSHDTALRALANHYDVVEVLGRGNFGIVYAAERRWAAGSRVALKVLACPGLMPYPEFLARFLREVRNAQRLDHPHVARIYEYGSLPGGCSFYAMDLCRGVSLLRRFHGVGLAELPEVGRLIGQLLTALGAAHAKRIVHRDVKPDNVQVVDGADGGASIKLLDFGIAKAFTGTASQDVTAPGGFAGTAAYMAPEQVQGVPLDGRADLYAVGVMLFELVAGRRPYVGESPVEVARGHLFDPVPSLAAVTQGAAPAALDAVVRRAMAKDREERFATADAMREALEAALRGTHPTTPVMMAPTAALASTPPSESLAPTLRLVDLDGRYRILREIPTAGRRGSAYEAYDRVEQRSVFVKMLGGDGAIAPEDRDRYLRGLAALNRVRHAHVVDLLDCGTAPDGRPYHVTEWVPGEPLTTFMVQGSAPLDEAAGVLCQVLDGLAVAHGQGIIHREVAPHHILVVPTERGTLVKLFGFALARPLFEPGHTLTRVELPAAPRYMAPEHLLGQSIDHRADLYSVGVILFEMLAGTPPFAGESAMALARAVLKGPVPALPATVHAATRAAIGDTLRRALAKDRDERFGAATELRAALLPLSGSFAFGDFVGAAG